jgi:hypothetical protein
MQEGQFKRAFCIMYNIYNYHSIEQIVKSCNGNENDALILADILQEGWYVPEDEFFPVHYSDLEETTSVARIKYAQIFNRLENRFGVKQMSTSCDPDRECFIRLSFNRDTVISLIDLYANV